MIFNISYIVKQPLPLFSSKMEAGYGLESGEPAKQEEDEAICLKRDTGLSALDCAHCHPQPLVINWLFRGLYFQMS